MKHGHDETPTAVVTGAGSGIGRAIALRMAKDGRRVAVVDINDVGARETVELIQADAGQAAFLHTDISDLEAVAALPAAVEAELGPVEIVVNNAGWDIAAPFLETTPELWHKVVAINYLGTVAMCHAFLMRMVERGSNAGRIVNIGSDAGRVGSMNETVYAGAKGGIIAFTKSLARETAKYQITVNCVCPGPTDTPLFHAQGERLGAALIRAVPLKRLGKPEELAAAVAFLASDDASFITGQVLSVSGGITMAG